MADLKAAAAFRGGKCHAVDPVDPHAPVQWECARGHVFHMTPNLHLKGGHWCPTCQVDVSSYDEIAAANPFFAQVWRQDMDPGPDLPSREISGKSGSLA